MANRLMPQQEATLTRRPKGEGERVGLCLTLTRIIPGDPRLGVYRCDDLLAKFHVLVLGK